ncbi:flavin-containing monooxygenase [Saccharospirillum mangrovi]|uniref:flavin-containing monooxygenase n=1 Tax=Saccharospirillum mangrovi TaxID=2161747 RepID=UPI000D3DC860|nr:NAD(P)-binding domain-containing protein [Saccharospirillum mangrovi]
MLPYAIIGAGPMGLCTARRLRQYQLPWIGFELNSGVGGLWDIDNPHSTMYSSAHLISSKTMTEFSDFPMAASVPPYPNHRQMKTYFDAYADRFELRSGFRFNTRVTQVVRDGDHWQIDTEHDGRHERHAVAGVLLASGTLHQPKRIELPGEFSGERLHSADYRDPALFDGKRVLIIGCGNSGCDIAVDAVHRAARVDLSVRRGYYFLPKFVAGRPIDTLGGKIRLPNRLKQWIDGGIIRALIGKPSDYGLPNPDYRLYESHPVVNSLFLHHLGHGDIQPRPDIRSVNGHSVSFADGQQAEYDLILEASGYRLSYPYIAQHELNWQGAAPDLFLNIFNPDNPNLFVMGMIEAAGLGWQGRDEQSHLVALYLHQRARDTHSARDFERAIRAHHSERCDGGMHYLTLDRMAYYVHKPTYLSALKKHQRRLRRDLESPLSTIVHSAEETA